MKQVWEDQWFSFGHIQFEIAISYLSDDVKQRVEYMTGVQEGSLEWR